MCGHGFVSCDVTTTALFTPVLAEWWTSTSSSLGPAAKPPRQVTLPWFTRDNSVRYYEYKVLLQASLCFLTPVRDALRHSAGSSAVAAVPAAVLLQGCGLVVFEDRAQAAAALDALNGCFQWPGARGPMVVEWMDVNKQVNPARLG